MAKVNPEEKVKNSQRYISQLINGERKIVKSKNFELDYFKYYEEAEHSAFMGYYDTEEYQEIKKELGLI